MRIYRVQIDNFRGIRQLDWIVGGKTVALIGPGDVGKTTILDAIELCLTPRISVAWSDTDFTDCDSANAIVIEVTLGELPQHLVTDEKYGLFLRGWSEDGLHDEPRDTDEPVITIRLTVDADLEARWVVANDRDERQILAKDRAALGVVRLGDEIERHFRWSRGSLLMKLTASDEEIPSALADMARTARQAVENSQMGALQEAAILVQTEATAMGAHIVGRLKPALDPQALATGGGVLALATENSVPLKWSGIGTKRLAALALERTAIPDGAIVLVDEVEYGLEPHRLRHLLKELRVPAGTAGQVILTTHSSVALVELNATELAVVRRTRQSTEALGIGAQFQGVVRSSPEALLATKVIVCEGATEQGLIRGLSDHFAERRCGKPLSHIGVSSLDGRGGDEALKRAAQLARLGYETVALLDSDREPNQRLVEKMKAAGGQLLQWPGGVATEERIFLDVPWEGIPELVSLAAAQKGELTVWSQVKEETTLISGLDDLKDVYENAEELELRGALGRAAKRCEWFKRIDLAEALAQKLVPWRIKMDGAPLWDTFTDLENWAYD